MSMDYIIASHGGADFNKTTQVPEKVKVLFYQPFGQNMPNWKGLKLQSALSTALTEEDAKLAEEAIKAHISCALWSGPTNQKPALLLTPDTRNPKLFFSGIVRALDKKIIYNMDRLGPIDLVQALKHIADDAHQYGPDFVRVHCLFCTS